MNQAIFKDRIEKVRRQVMAPLGLDMLLAYADDPFAPGAVRYLTDYDTYAVYSIVAVPAEGDVTLAFGQHHSAYLVRTKDVAIADYFRGTYSPGQLCSEVLGKAGGKVGLVGGGNMIQRIQNDLRASLTDATLSEVDAEFWRAAIPDDNDLGRAAALARQGIEVAAARKAGLTTRELAAEIGLTLRRRGVDVMSRELIQMAMASGTPLPDRLAPPGDAVIEGCLALELAPVYRGIRVLIGRTLGPPELADRLQAAMRIHAEICALPQVGRSAAEFAVAAGKLAPGAEFGHGIGYALRSAPILDAQNSTVLADGMVLAIRTRHDAGALGTIHLADTIQLKKAGPRILTV